MSLLRGKYKLPVLYCLQINGPTRYNELMRRLEHPTNRALTNTLKELESDGLIVRTVYAQIPPKVVYSLSDLGESLEPMMDAFCEWGEAHRPMP